MAQTQPNLFTPLYEALGRAVAAWARVEGELSYWFVAISGLDEAMARDLFFTPTSFNARVELLSTVIDHSSASKAHKDFAAIVLEKCKRYSAVRNKLVHWSPHTDLEGLWTPILVPFPEPPMGVRPSNCLTVDQISNAAENFQILSRTMTKADIGTRIGRESLDSLQTLGEAIRRLPHPTDPPPADLP
jgi:hypothetical protein